jgi:hypothetical protein
MVRPITMREALIQCARRTDGLAAVSSVPAGRRAMALASIVRSARDGENPVLWNDVDKIWLHIERRECSN